MNPHRFIFMVLMQDEDKKYNPVTVYAFGNTAAWDQMDKIHPNRPTILWQEYDSFGKKTYQSDEAL